MKIRVHRDIPEGWKLRSVTVTKEPSGKYYASLLYKLPESENQAKGKEREAKEKRRVAIVHEKVRNQRKDFLHKLSRELADSYDVIGVEDIDMKSMSRSMHFGKSVLDNGYGMFRTLLSYKLEEKDGELVKVGRYFPSSRRCSVCGKVKEDLKLSDRVYRCSCGNCMDRDVNAAINIRMEAMRLKAS